VAEHPQTNRSGTRRVTVAEASRILGISTGAVRNRINRGTLEAERESGTVYVLLSPEHTADTQQVAGDYPGEYNTLTSALEARIESLERQLEEARERDRENRRLLAAALERIPPQLEAPSEPRESPETAMEGERLDSPTPEQQRPWWRRMFGA
jgi:hypothetical protein